MVALRSMVSEEELIKVMIDKLNSSLKLLYKQAAIAEVKVDRSAARESL